MAVKCPLKATAASAVMLTGAQRQTMDSDTGSCTLIPQYLAELLFSIWQETWFSILVGVSVKVRKDGVLGQELDCAGGSPGVTGSYQRFSQERLRQVRIQ